VLPLLRIGGLAAVVNTLWNGDVIDPEDAREGTAIQVFNRKLLDDERVSLSLSSLTTI
jgi:predicted O-methyltransferase YrrM